ncbi:putative TetR family transcriptional regulator [Gordonia effusa NBRC 100432]|uniref:Putative TetR family transcriptional regulator n=1 Tax=Gordonia effusa NBRC 100432 TaxID=1077974 RepID=H0QYE9_9ACTN|nr:TetR/AcrR family transcriptional regulator [Gordonia effusa]GAB17850.1 putative TetR family transcriptional regulator [Gordonia effusa NBRC 100432]
MTSTERSDWLAGERAELAAGRILDIAERLFVDDGVNAVTMRQVATAVGCSRATLYRYFPSREALQLAYVDRVSRQVARQVADAVGEAVGDERVIVAITTALAGVRANPALLAWFTPDAAGTATDLALISPAVEHLVADFLGGSSSTPNGHLRAQWLVRVIVSLLTSPGESPAAEEQLLRAFVLPVL